MTTDTAEAVTAGEIPAASAVLGIDYPRDDAPPGVHDVAELQRQQPAHDGTVDISEFNAARLRRLAAADNVDSVGAWVAVPMCLVPACKRGTSSRGLCATHYRMFTRGQPLLPLRTDRGGRPAGAPIDVAEYNAARGCDVHGVPLPSNGATAAESAPNSD